MPIEDIDFLKNNSIKQRYIFLVDSSDRNRLIHPTPSEYFIEFTIPFYNVVGLEVIDSAIPRTMYNIDVYNNSFVFCIYDPLLKPLNTITPSDYTTIYIDPGDYTIQTLIVAINSVLKQNDIAIIIESLSNPPEIKNKVKFHCSYPFIFDMSKSTIAETLGFDLYTSTIESSLPINEQRYIAIENQIFGSVNIIPNQENIDYYTYEVFTGPRGVVRRQSIGLPNKIAQRFTIRTRGFLRDVQAALSNSLNVIVNTNTVRWELWSNDPVNNKPLAYLNAFNVIETSYIDGGYSDSATNINKWLLEGTYWIILSSTQSTIELYYNDVSFSSELSNLMLISPDSGASWNSIDDTVNRIYFQASIIITVQEDYNVITSPGIYNLLGEKYITLRCPEIEQNSFRYLAYSKYFMGLAKFKLDTVGYNNQIVDFNDTNKREFHPIGKLTKLTLRFETSKGQKYDFKGVNHTITFGVYYYEPVQKEKFENSTLNPNYKGNFIDYMYQQKEQEEDSDDQEYDYDRDNIDNYKIMENRYNPNEITRIDDEVRYKLFNHDE